MSVDLPSVVVVEEAPASVRSLATLRNAEVRALSAWRTATGLHAIDLPEPTAPPAPPSDPTRPARLLRIEQALHDARGALDLGDPKIVPETRAALALAYAEAREHADDPEAPFLVAELLRSLSRVEELAGDPDGARALRHRARLLDGGRLVGLSEGGPLEVEKLVEKPFALGLVDAPPHVALFIDGEPREGALALAAGEHHLRIVAEDGHTLHARWFFAGAGLTVSLGFAAPACTASDLGPALVALAKDAQATFSVRCGRWLRVARRTSALELRVCASSACGPASVWSTVPLVEDKKPVPTTSVFKSGWTWAAIGAGAVALGTLTAWRLGAFDRNDPGPPTWRWEGAK